MIDNALVDRLAARLAGIRPSGARALVGIAGAPGSGKSTLATALQERAGVARVPMDGFHLTDAELVRLGRRDRKGAPDTFDVAGYRAVLQRLRAGGEVRAPDFDRVADEPVPDAIVVPAGARIVVSEGNYLLLPEWTDVRAQFDEVWFCHVADDVRRARLIARHVRYGKGPDAARAWVRDVDDRNAELVDASAGGADLVVPLS